MVPRRVEVIESVAACARCLSASETIVQANRKSRGLTYPNTDGQELRKGERLRADTARSSIGAGASFCVARYALSWVIAIGRRATDRCVCGQQLGLRS